MMADIALTNPLLISISAVVLFLLGGVAAATVVFVVFHLFVACVAVVVAVAVAIAAIASLVGVVPSIAVLTAAVANTLVATAAPHYSCSKLLSLTLPCDRC